RTALCQVAAEALGIAPEKVTLVLGDTRPELRAVTSAGSSTLPSLAPAVREAAVQAKERGNGQGRRRPNRKDRAIRTCGAQCVEVAVDLRTGEVKVLRVAASHDCGRVVNATLVDSQL